jgi:hypothetical protein
MPSNNNNNNTNTRKPRKAKCSTCGKKFPDRKAVTAHRSSTSCGKPALAPYRNRRTPPTRVVFQPAASARQPGILSRQLDKVPLGSTVYGSDFCRRYLHPCDEARVEPMKIPDDVNDQSAAVEQRIYSVQIAPEAATNNWDLQVVSLPFPDVPIALRRRPAGGTWSYWHAVTDTPTFPPGVTRLGTSEPVSPGSTHYKLTSNPLIVSKPKLFTSTDTYRGVARGLTFDLNANALSNQGFIMAGQWGNKTATTLNSMFPTQPEFSGDGTPLENTPPHQPYWVIKDIPAEPADLMAKVAGACEWKSTEGFYMPIHYEDPQHPFKEFSTWNYDAIGGSDLSGCPIALCESSENNQVIVNLNADLVYTSTSNPLTGHECLTSAGSLNQMVGCVIFTGLDKTASIIIKVISDYELIPSTGSDLTVAVTKAPVTDMVAVKMTQSVTTGLPMGFPSRYNNLGLIMKSIQPLVKPAMNIAMPWIADRLAGRVRNIRANSAPTFM